MEDLDLDGAEDGAVDGVEDGDLVPDLVIVPGQECPGDGGGGDTGVIIPIGRISPIKCRAGPFISPIPMPPTEKPILLVRQREMGEGYERCVWLKGNHRGIGYALSLIHI